MSARTLQPVLLPAFVLVGVLLAASWSAPTPHVATVEVSSELWVHGAPTVRAPEGVTGRLETRGNRRVLTLWGSPRERGYAQGYLLADVIVRGIEHDFERVLKPFIPTYESVVRRGVVPKFGFSPRELEEMEGLHEGLVAALPEERRIVKGLDRAFDLTDIKALNTFGDWYGLGCSSLAVWGRLTHDGKPLVGRNFDFPGFYLLVAHQYIVVRAPDGEAQGQVGVSYPGSIGTMTGMNPAGVFVAIHDVRIKPAFDKAMRPNVPRLIAVRRLLEQTRGADACAQALRLTRAWPTLYGNNLMVVAPGTSETSPQAAVLEYDCRTDLEGGCTMRIVDTEGVKPDAALPAMCLTCTNHHRCRPKPADYVDLYKRWRFPLLSSVEGLELPREEAFDVPGLFARMNRVSFPREGTQQLATAIRGPARAHGTLHQAVGEPDRACLHIRLGAVGTHIRDVPPMRIDVPARVAAAAAAR